MYDLKMKQMECFLDVAESLNITATARKLFISQPLASKWIMSLEEELDMKLFRREKTGLVLTEEGMYLKEHWALILKELRTSIEDAHLIGEDLDGVLRIGCLESYQYGEYLHALLAAYQAKNPKVRIEINSYGVRQSMDLLMQGDLDMLVHTTLDLKEHAELTWIPIKEMRFCIALGKSHPLAEKEKLEISDLKEEKLFLLNAVESPSSKNRITKICKKAGFQPKEFCEVSNFSSLAMGLIYQGGAALLPEECILGYKDQMKLFYPEELNLSPEYLAFVGRAKKTGEIAKRFAEFASNYAKDNAIIKRP